MDLLNIDENKYTKMIEIEDKKIEELKSEKRRLEQEIEEAMQRKEKIRKVAELQNTLREKLQQREHLEENIRDLNCTLSELGDGMSKVRKIFLLHSSYNENCFFNRGCAINHNICLYILEQGSFLTHTYFLNHFLNHFSITLKDKKQETGKNPKK